jgi:hypothetical protein
MEPIAIALIVSVLFNLYCFKEVKLLQTALRNKTERHNQEIGCYKQELVKSLGYVNVYKQSNGKHRISSIPQTRQYIRSNRKMDSVNKFIGTAEVFISTPEK